MINLEERRLENRIMSSLFLMGIENKSESPAFIFAHAVSIEIMYKKNEGMERDDQPLMEE